MSLNETISQNNGTITEQPSGNTLTNAFSNASKPGFFSTENIDKLAEHAKAGLASAFSSVSVGTLEDINMGSRNAQDKKDEELKRLKLHMLQSNIRQLEQDIIVLNQRIERNDTFIERLDTIEKRLENADPSQKANTTDIKDLEQLSKELGELPQSTDRGQDIEIKDVRNRLDRFLNSKHRTNGEALQTCRDGKCTLRDARSAMENTIKAKQIKILDYQQEAEQSGINVKTTSETLDTNTETNSFAALAIEPDLEYGQRLAEIMNQVEAGMIVSSELDNLPDELRAKVERDLEIKGIEIKPESPHAKHVTISANYDPSKPSLSKTAFNDAASNPSVSLPKHEIDLDQKYNPSPFGQSA